MDEIWVPSEFSKQVFIESGVNASKIFIIMEPVDVDFYDPSKTTLLLPRLNEKEFRFLSVFKWEKRKGWEILLEAYFSEFTSNDDVILYILTSEFHHDTSKSIHEIIEEFAKDKFGKDALPKLAKFQLLKGLSSSDMPRLYKSVDCLVIPSRGEGWVFTINGNLY